MPSNLTAIPVTLLTGFLGSGKTTLLNRLLEAPALKDTALIINEFGSVSVDHDLVRRGNEQYIVTSTGCLCCTASSDIRASLYALHEETCRGDLPPFRRVVIETTGLADPAPIVNSLIAGGAVATAFSDHVVARTFRLAGIVCTVDAEHGPDALDNHFECWKQVAFADQIVLTKTDLVPGAMAKERLRVLNPMARFHDGNDPGFDPLSLIGEGCYAISGKPEDVPGWLAMERLPSLSRHDHSHDPNRHGAGIEAFALVDDEPLDPRAVDGFLNVLTSQPHAGLLRLKGIFALADDPARPMVAHAVQHRLYPTARLDYWPDIDVRTRVVIIGNDMPIEPVRKMFDALRPRTGILRRVFG